MPFVESVNSKANVKQFTTNDLPFSPSQPVINSYYATSTAGQTSITNLGFTVNTSSTGFTDSFWLFVDGKKLDLGSSNDYVFAAIAADGSSSQITFNQSLVAGLNIQAFKLGLKPEIQFGMDNRFTQLYANQASGFQGFVSQTDAIIVASSSTGTPAAGTFYSTIANRAPLPDLSQDLKPRMGIERIAVQNIYQVQNEFGSAGELIWAVQNDTFGQIRFGGTGWNNFNNANGPFVNTNVANDYVEIVFYGTGLNALLLLGTTSPTITVSVDGVQTSASLLSNYNGVLQSRNYAANEVINAVSGLALGIHTVTLKQTVIGSGIQFNLYGLEILNESSSVKVNSGTGYVQGQKLSLAAQSAFSYSAPVTGTRGGRILVYQKSDGTISQAFTATGSVLKYPSADHTLEEVVRTYFIREFGAGRADDFSLGTASANRAFTLDDGTTTLVGVSTQIGAPASGAPEGLAATTNSQDFAYFTFVGTGIDVQWTGDATGTNSNANAFTWAVDGGTPVNWPTAAVAGQYNTIKLASGLQYGTHVITFTRNVPSVWTLYLRNFTTYQPKTPALPSGAIQLGTYNALANFTANTGVSGTLLGTGLLRKPSIKEHVYTGTGWTVALFPISSGEMNGQVATTPATSDTVSYTFFGTGFEWRFSHNTVSTTMQIAVDGSTNLTGFTTSSQLTGTSTFTASTGTLVTGTTSAVGGSISVSALTLGLHTVKITKTAGAGSFAHESFDIIAPIHSVKSNLYGDIQNALPVGSNSISDDRQTTPVKNVLPATKAWAEAVGVTSSPTTTAASPGVPVPDLSLTMKTTGGPLEIAYQMRIISSAGVGGGVFTQLYVDGVAVGVVEESDSVGSADQVNHSGGAIVPVAAGTHKIDLYWFANGGATLTGQNRLLRAREF